MRTNNRAARPAFTLIELLVVVAIIALLISILLPSLACAREQAKAAKCGVQMRGFGLGLNTYANDNRDWLPGPNTTGVNFCLQIGPQFKKSDLREERVGTFVNLIERWDWMSTVVSYDTELNGNRAERFRFLLTHFRCPSMQGIETNELFGTANDESDFMQFNSFPAISYLMPGSMLLWGNSHDGQTFGDPIVGLQALTILSVFNTRNDPYVSQLTRVGNAARKIAVADGTRYLESNGTLDFDLNPKPNTYGSFASGGAWWSGSTAYGVKQGSENWDGMAVSAGSPAAGKNLALSYRHHCNRTAAPQDAKSNKGEMNALFFDGHVDRMGDRKSRNPEFWYPKGTNMIGNSDGMTYVPTDGSWTVP